MARCLIAVGANLGDRATMLTAAVDRLAAAENVAVLARSQWKETPAIGGPPGQPAYLNGAVTVETSRTPEELHALLHEIERDLGRRRLVKWEARLVDLDLLLYDREVRATPTLTLPHPRMAFRRFVLEPAAQVAADMVHPTIGWTMEKLWRHLVEALPYAAVTGAAKTGKTRLADDLARGMAGVWIKDPAGTSAAGLTSPNKEREIEFFAQRQLVLERDKWTHLSKWAVSDFWFGQSLAWAAAMPQVESFMAVRDAWREALAKVIPPKLLIVLERGDEKPAGNGGAAGQPRPDDPGERDQSMSDSFEGRLQHFFAEQVRLCHEGPVLRLPAVPTGVGSTSDYAALTEAAAALSAMQ